MKVTVIGAGYVGLTTAALFAYLGHHVSCVDNSSTVIGDLKEGKIHIYEPGLRELVSVVQPSLCFDLTLQPEHLNADVLVICVGTPSKENGDANLEFVQQVAFSVGNMLPEGRDVVIVNKSTVPVGTAQLVESVVLQRLKLRAATGRVRVVSAPEFLREGSALQDSLFPERVLVGTDDEEAAARVKVLYAPVLQQSFAPPVGVQRPEGYTRPSLVLTTTHSAELAKYAANTFLAMKISFANEIANVAERVGADVNEVMRAVGLDSRIGHQFLRAGAGWGGSCFGKDTKALLALGEQYGCEMALTSATIEVNRRQRQIIIQKLQRTLGVLQGKNIAIWGITFKPDTDDLRDAPAVDVIRGLNRLGACVTAYDPMGLNRARREWNDVVVEYACSPQAAVNQADAIVLLTEWAIFLNQDWNKVRDAMRTAVIVDGRNALDGDALTAMGFRYQGIGRWNASVGAGAH